MGFSHGDRALETTTTTGTGAVTLLGAVTGYRAFSSIATANGDQFPYVIASGTEWEVGIGTRTGATTFTRDVITASSNAGAIVTFSAGTKEVWIDSSSAFLNGLRAQNLIINGGQEVSQVYGTAAQAAFNGPLTDIYSYGSSGAQVATCQQVTDAPPGFKYSFKVSITTANAAPGVDDYSLIIGYIEGYRAARLGFGAAGAQSFSRGLWVKAHRTGTYSIAFVPFNFGRSYATTFAVNAADTWEYKTFVIPGDIAGTWSTTNTAFCYFYVALMVGTNYQQTAGSWAVPAAHGWAYGATGTINGVAATTDTFQITGDSIVPGSVPVSEAMSSLIVRPFDEELELCKRYYQKSFVYTTAPAQNVGIFTGEFQFPVMLAGAVTIRSNKVELRPTMRTTPTVTFYNPAAANADIRDETASSDFTGSTPQAQSESGFFANGTGPAGSAIGQICGVHYTADARL